MKRKKKDKNAPDPLGPMGAVIGKANCAECGRPRHSGLCKDQVRCEKCGALVPMGNKRGECRACGGFDARFFDPHFTVPKEPVDRPEDFAEIEELLRELLFVNRATLQVLKAQTFMIAIEARVNRPGNVEIKKMADLVTAMKDPDLESRP